MIKFTQYLRPNGIKQAVEIKRPKAVEEMADKIIEAGGEFEVEVLSTGTISLEVVREKDGDMETLSAEICDNGPAVLIAVDKLVKAAFDAC